MAATTPPAVQMPAADSSAASWQLLVHLRFEIEGKIFGRVFQQLGDSSPYERAKIRNHMNIFPPSLLAFFLAMATGFAGWIPALEAATAEQQAVLAPVMALFDGMAKRDPGLMKKVLLSGGTMVLMRDGKPTQLTFEAFVDRVSRPGTTAIEERIHNPLVRIDHDLAVVWAPFEFLADGKVDHCGTDLFNLVRSDGKWLIASVADTGRKNCSVK